MGLDGERTILKQNPAVFRNQPFLFFIAVLTIPILVGVIILFVLWLEAKCTTITITSRRTTLRKGILSKHTNEVFHSNVRNVQISQSFFQRLLDVGSIGISSAGQSGVEIEENGFRSPERLRELIYQHMNEPTQGATRTPPQVLVNQSTETVSIRQ